VSPGTAWDVPLESPTAAVAVEGSCASQARLIVPTARETTIAMLSGQFTVVDTTHTPQVTDTAVA
jgi:hypothetical protein